MIAKLIKMNNKSVYFKARQTILEMFQDRGYEGPFREASAMVASDFYKKEISSNGTPNPDIDLKGFVEKRSLPNPEGGPDLTIKVPVYVHFTSSRKPKKGGIKKIELYEKILEKDFDQIDLLAKDYPESFRPNYKGHPDDFTKTISDEIVMLGVHLLIIYDGWDFSKNKESKDATFIYGSGDREKALYDLEIWPVHMLVVNYSRHTLVPVHKLLSPEEKQKFLDEQAKFYLNDDDRKKYDDLAGLDKHKFIDNYVFQVMPKIGLQDPINLYYYGRLRQIYQIVRKGKSPTYRMVRKNPLLKDTGK